MKKRDILCIAMGIVAVALAVAGWMLLPDRVAMQIGMDGGLQNYMPKPLATLLMLALQAVMILLYRSSGRGAHLAAAVVVLVLPLFTFGINL